MKFVLITSSHPILPAFTDVTAEDAQDLRQQLVASLHASIVALNSEPFSIGRCADALIGIYHVASLTPGGIEDLEAITLGKLEQAQTRAEAEQFEAMFPGVVRVG